MSPGREELGRQGAGRDVREAGLKARVLDRIRNEIWLKLWGNVCFNPISALTRATLDVIARILRRAPVKGE